MEGLQSGTGIHVVFPPKIHASLSALVPMMASGVDRECRELVGLTSTVSGGDRERFLLFF
jgi:hypothetical protein